MRYRPRVAQPMDDGRINTRTAHKGIALETTLCSNGVINCWSDLGSGKVHSVHLTENGSIDRCTCKGWTHHGYCYHTDAIRANRRLRMAARATMNADKNRSGNDPVRASETDASANTEVLADGGVASETCENDTLECPGPYHHTEKMCADCLDKSRVPELEDGEVNRTFAE